MAAISAIGSSSSPSPPFIARRDTISIRCSVIPPDKDAKVPRLLKFAVSGATEFLRLLASSNKNKRNDWTSKEVCVISSIDEVVEMLRLDYNNAYFLTGKFTPDIYAEDCLFEDPTIKFRGKDRYSQNLALLVPFLDHPSLSLEKIGKEMDCNVNSITAKWKLSFSTTNFRLKLCNNILVKYLSQWKSLERSGKKWWRSETRETHIESETEQVAASNQPLINWPWGWRWVSTSSYSHLCRPKQSINSFVWVNEIPEHIIQNWILRPFNITRRGRGE